MKNLRINNIPISLIDTAGLRETSDKVESIGVERSKRLMIDADLVVVILDGHTNLRKEDTEILAQAQDLNHLIAVNKNDLVQTDIQVKYGSQKFCISLLRPAKA